jgi:hypothetical protein
MLRIPDQPAQASPGTKQPLASTPKRLNIVLLAVDQQAPEHQKTQTTPCKKPHPPALTAA